MKSILGQPSVAIVTDKSVADFAGEIAHHVDQEEPFIVADLADIVCKYKLWKLKMPRVQPFYAVKCNDYSTILHLLASLGTGFDCASRGEIEAVLSTGVDPSRIIYANPCKLQSHIRHAKDVGVNLMTFDNEMELHKLKALYPHCRLIIRIRVDDSSAVCQLGVKFGCDLQKAEHLLNVAKQFNLNVVGVSFHVGSGCKDATAFSKAVESARLVFDKAAAIGYNFNILDIGGGFPGSKEPGVSFEEIANVINVSLDQLFPQESGVQIIAEPGRYFVASAFTLYTNIISIREGDDNTTMYYINDGVYGSFNCVIFDHAVVHPVPLSNCEGRKRGKCSLWGPTCDSIDLVLEKITLPELKLGEWLVFEDMGAYTIAAASTFNGFPKPAVKCVLPIHALSYLQQLPAWPDLVDAIGDLSDDTDQSYDPDQSDDPDLSDDYGPNTETDICMLPVPESVSA